MHLFEDLFILEKDQLVPLADHNRHSTFSEDQPSWLDFLLEFKTEKGNPLDQAVDILKIDAPLVQDVEISIPNGNHINNLERGEFQTFQHDHLVILKACDEG